MPLSAPLKKETREKGNIAHSTEQRTEGARLKRERGPHLFRKMKTYLFRCLQARPHESRFPFVRHNFIRQRDHVGLRSPFCADACVLPAFAPLPHVVTHTSYGRKFPGWRSRAIKRKITTERPIPREQAAATPATPGRTFHLFLCCQLQNRAGILIHRGRARRGWVGGGAFSATSLIDSLLTDSITSGYRLCDYDPVQLPPSFYERSCDSD